MKALSFRSVVVSFDGNVVLNGVSFDVDVGDFVAVIGPNGAGKTTLLKITAGLIKPDSGTVEVMGFPVPSDDARKRIGYLPQLKYFKHSAPFKVGEAVELIGRMKGVEVSVEDTLSLVNLSDKKNHYIGDLSGGQQRRLLVAMTLVGNPELVLLDEPTAGLDVASREDLLAVVYSLHQKLKNTVVIVTHDVNEVYPYITKVIYINRSTFAVGQPEEVLKPELLEEVYGVPVEVFRHGERICVLAGDVHSERTY